MNCWTIVLNQNGEHTVTEGIEFERTSNPEIGFLHAGGMISTVSIPSGFEGKVMKYVLIYKRDPLLQIAGINVIDVFGGYYEESNQSPLVLLCLNQQMDEDHLFIHYKFVGEISDTIGDDLGRYDNFTCLGVDSGLVGDFSDDLTSALILARENALFDFFTLGKFQFKIMLDELNRPKIEVREKIEDEKDESEIAEM